MARTPDQPTTRVQVYFENPKIEKALRREAAVAKIPLSRAAEHAIARGLHKRPNADPEDRLLSLDRALRDHMRSTARDMAILHELTVEVARALFLRLPDAPADRDPLVQAAADARVERMLDAAAARIAAGAGRPPAAPEPAINGDAGHTPFESPSFAPRPR
jgi:hypothetical protein